MTSLVITCGGWRKELTFQDWKKVMKRRQTPTNIIARVKKDWVEKSFNNNSIKSVLLCVGVDSVCELLCAEPTLTGRRAQQENQKNHMTKTKRTFETKLTKWRTRFTLLSLKGVMMMKMMMMFMMMMMIMVMKMMRWWWWRGLVGRSSRVQVKVSRRFFLTDSMMKRFFGDFLVEF